MRLEISRLPQILLWYSKDVYLLEDDLHEIGIQHWTRGLFDEADEIVVEGMVEKFFGYVFVIAEDIDDTFEHL